MNKKEREICGFIKEIFFCWRSNLSNDDIISLYRPGLKTGRDFRGQGPVSRKSR